MSSKRVLHFLPDPQGFARFRYVWSAALNGPLLSQPDGQKKQRSWDEQRTDGKIIRALKAISVETVFDKDLTTEMRVRKLRLEGGSVTLTASQFAKLREWWEKMQWGTYDIDDIDDAYEWLMGAPEEQERSAPVEVQDARG